VFQSSASLSSCGKFASLISFAKTRLTGETYDTEHRAVEQAGG